jgi:hypothetical protein
MSYTEKINYDFYISSYPVINKSFNPKNILLCNYNIIDVALFLKQRISDTKILIHNFANNNEPCNGNFNTKVQENEIYNRTNISDSIIPNKYKLYPIQKDETINMLITENCFIDNTNFNIDIASLNALSNPPEKNLDLYSKNELIRYDYAKITDKEDMEKKLLFLLSYSVGEDYDYLLTGAWGFDISLNPYWGLINLWNTCLEKIYSPKLKIIFCIPNNDDIYLYNYFREYLIGQKETPIPVNIDEKEHIKLNEEELIIKRKIYGLVWGLTLSEIVSYYLNSDKNTDLSLLHISNPINWDCCTEHTILLMRVLRESFMDLNINKMAKYLVEWKNISSLGRTIYTQPNIKNLLSQPDYIRNPLQVAQDNYKLKNYDDFSSVSIGKNALNGIFKDYMRRSLVVCKMLQPDTSCQVSCLVHSYIINCIWNGKYITSQDWGYLLSSCYKIFDTNPNKSVQYKIDFDNFWSIGKNYQYQISNGIKSFIEYHLKPGPFRSENHTFLPMTLCMIIMYDIQGYILINNKPAREMMSVTEIPILDDLMREKKINFNEYLPKDYYFKTMEELCLINSNNICDAVIGSVLGLASWNNVYNDNVERNELGNIVENNSQKWIQCVNNAKLLNNEIDQFIDTYLMGRRNALKRHKH